MNPAKGNEPAQPDPAVSARRQPTTTDLAVAICGCVVWTMAGTSARLLFTPWFQAMGFLAPELTYFGYNAAGSFVMGAAACLLDPVEHFAIYRWLTTGFCGAFTSLSMWIITACLTAPRGAGSSSVVQIVCGLTVPFAFYQWGFDAAAAVRSYMPPVLSLPSCFVSRLQWPEREKVLLIVCWLVAAVLLLVLPLTSGANVSRPSLYAVLFSPVGGVSRFLLGYFLNGRAEFRKVPVGTFVANVTAVVVGTIVVSTVTNTTWTTIIVSGFCGALSTVSSWVHEIHHMIKTDTEKPLGYAYALVTLCTCCTIAALGRAG